MFSFVKQFNSVGLVNLAANLFFVRCNMFSKYFIFVILCLQSAPISILENHELASMTLEYRRECGRDSVLQSLTAVSNDCTGGLAEASIECQHLLQLECGAELVRGRTQWRPRRAPGLGNMAPTSSGSA